MGYIHNDAHIAVFDGTTIFLSSTTLLGSSASKYRLESDSLQRSADPEVKRRIIGDAFMKVKDMVIARLNLDPAEVILAQGTLRPDLIESASMLISKSADKIKTHHNDSDLVRTLRDQGRVIEPLRDFHKDEVRQLGRDLGLPEHIVDRHPFPGPGLAIRILCAVNEPYVCDANPLATLTFVRRLCHYAQEELVVGSFWPNSPSCITTESVVCTRDQPSGERRRHVHAAADHGALAAFGTCPSHSQCGRAG